MEVKHIEYNREKYPIRVGYRALKKVKEDNPDKKIKVNKDGVEIGDITDNEPLLYYSLQSGHFAKFGNLEMPFEKKDMEFILDECLFEFLKLVREFTIEMEKAAPEETETTVPATGNRQQRRANDKGKSKP